MDTRTQLLLAALKHVPFEGWSQAALIEGAKSCGLSMAEAMEAFPAGASDLLDSWAAWADGEMAAAMEKTRGIAAMRMGEKVALAIRLRLQILEPYREAERLALNYLALPPHPFLATHLLTRTVNAIWRAAGDESVDFSYYTKRASLAAIYTTVHLFWLADTSERHESTWRFMEARLGHVAQFAKFRRKATETAREKASFVADRLRQGLRKGAAKAGL